MTSLLVVEDSPTQAQELAFLLEAEGFEVTVARDGGAGLSHCRSHSVDAVLSDVVMPVLDGYQLCKQLKSEAGTAAIPVILLTSLADPMDIVRGLECGADNFITKPYDAAYLIGRVRRLLDNKAMRGKRKLSMGVDVLLMGKRLTINSEKEQMLDLLISTFEEVLRSRQREYEAKLSEETFRESHRFLQSALDGLSAQITILDSQGMVMAANAPWRSLVEANAAIGPNAGIGLPYAEVHALAFGTEPAEASKIGQGVLSVGSGLKVHFALEFAARIREEMRWFSLLASRFEDRGAFLIAIEHEDISARKQLEQQLHHSQKMEAIGQLAGGVAHDFNNLLTVINGYAGFLLSDLPGDDPRCADVEQIVQAATTAASLTRQLLAFSRRQVLKPTVLDINAAIAEVEKMLRRLIGDDIVYTTVLEPNLGRVYADEAQVQQILMNLVVNARDAMPKGGGLTVETSNTVLDETYASLHSGVKPGNYVRLSVTDTGEGMTSETQARIFEPFFTTKDVGKGTGLGLATVYGIVQQSGGHIWVYSEIGRGTVIKIHLPRVDEEALASLLPDAPKDLPRSKSETILVVEDNEAVRVMLCRILRSIGYQVLEAGVGSEARELCNRHHGAIHLLISDIVMPEMSGIDLSLELMGARPEMKIMLMSGYSGMALMSQGEPRPGMAFMEKPFTAESVARKVRELLDA
jgi:two-component system, cell cycle sensor histidine kinase and response regulator CckA